MLLGLWSSYFEQAQPATEQDSFLFYTGNVDVYNYNRRREEEKEPVIVEALSEPIENRIIFKPAFDLIKHDGFLMQRDELECLILTLH